MVGLVILRFNPAGDFWKSAEIPKAQLEACDPRKLVSWAAPTTALYREEALHRLVREPQNTISNLAYFFTGFAVLLAAATVPGRALGLAGIFLALGSGLYHCSLLPEWRLIDILGVYVVLGTLLVLGLGGIVRGWSSGWRAWAWPAAAWVAAAWMGIHRNDYRWGWFKPFDSTVVVAAGMAGGFVLVALAWRKIAVQDRRRAAALSAGMTGCFVVAILGGQGDRAGGFWANPNGLIQGHAVWHVAGAAALLLAYEIFALADVEWSTCRRAAGREEEAK